MHGGGGTNEATSSDSENDNEGTPLEEVADKGIRDPAIQTQEQNK